MDRRSFLKMAAVSPVAPLLAARPERASEALHAGKFDLVVVGGSTTGVFAAVRVMRMRGLLPSIKCLFKKYCFG